MADRPTVSVKSLGGSKYKVSYKMYAPGISPTDAAVHVTRDGALEFSAMVGIQQFHDVSMPIPGIIAISSQETKGDTHVVTLKCSYDPSEYLE